MKLLVTGHAQHGKDTVCEILAKKFSLNFVSSSYFCMERAVIPWLANLGITYATPEECYADRANHRAHWYDAINDYNTPDRARLGRELFVEHDIYCGLRNFEEFSAQRAEGLFDFSIWVDRIRRVPPEPSSSITIQRDDCDFVLDNNRGLFDLEVRVKRLYTQLIMLKRAEWFFVAREPLHQPYA